MQKYNFKSSLVASVLQFSLCSANATISKYADGKEKCITEKWKIYRSVTIDLAIYSSTKCVTPAERLLLFLSNHEFEQRSRYTSFHLKASTSAAALAVHACSLLPARTLTTILSRTRDCFSSPQRIIHTPPNTSNYLCEWPQLNSNA